MSHPGAGREGVAAGEGPVCGAAPEGPVEVESVYVHAPFCARRCVYCDFAVQVRATGNSGEWSRALAGELEALEREGRVRLPDRLDTLYVGGGTPSLLGPEAMAELADVLGAARVGGVGIEWTAEANPESFTPALASGWRAAGVNRISLGVQSFHEPSLRWMGRLHGPDGAIRSVSVAREAGLDELSVDLIFGLPARTGRSWIGDLDRVLGLGVPHVSLYGLSVEPGTALGRAVDAGRESVAGEERYREEYLEAVERLSGAGYVHYEVSNFALPGHESRHNRVYWEGGAYLGLGNGAHSHLGPVRRWNLRDWSAYQSAAAEGRLPIEGEERPGRSARRLEELWLGLRTDRGLPLNGLRASALDLAHDWTTRGWASLDGGTLRLTAEGWLVMDRLVVELDERLDAAGDPPSPPRAVLLG